MSNSYNGDNPPYGSATTAGAGRTAVIEAWGEHVGLLFADKRYGISCFASTLERDIDRKQRARYIYRPSGLERFNPNSSSLDAWIPAGLFWDLLDDSTHNQAPLSVNDPVIDNVQGVNHATMFRAITQNAPTEVVNVKDVIKNEHPTINTNIDSLFVGYGY